VEFARFAGFLSIPAGFFSEFTVALRLLR
jgi:hypothetical protein